jgi:hypothetical protein
LTLPLVLRGTCSGGLFTVVMVGFVPIGGVVKKYALLSE